MNDSKYKIVPTPQFKKDLKKYLRKPTEKQAISKIIDLLAQDGVAAIPPKNKPHQLIGKLKDCLECHIKPDLLIIWEQDDWAMEIFLVRLGSHSDLF
jgi:mRNA interferase YafQ